MEEEAVKLAIEQIKKERKQAKTKNVLIICLTIILCVSIICGTVLALCIIREQQYALNMQYAQLFDLIIGAEIVEEADEQYNAEAKADNGGVAVASNGDATIGGDVNGVGTSNSNEKTQENS